jgi:hypothetical protein
MSFLQGLGKIINEQYGFGENTTNSLNTTDDGRLQNFGLLGDFAKKIDQAASRSYLQSGYVSNIRPQLKEVIWQSPDMTILIKKRMFSSLIDNFRLDMADENEKLFYRASKRLFQNKCRLISIYERLSKIEKLAQETGVINSNLLPTILSGVNEISNAGLNIFNADTRSTMATLRDVFAYSETSDVTTWVGNKDTLFTSDLGEGTGVIELTMVNSITVNNSVKFGNGSCSFSIEDPYKLFIVREPDIEAAITDASNFFKNSGFGRFVEIETENLITNQKAELNAVRAARGACSIKFTINPESLISKKVRAYFSSEGREVLFTYEAGLGGLGSDVKIDKGALDTTGNIPTNVEYDENQNPNNFTDDEADLFKSLIKNIFLYLGYKAASSSEIKGFNEATNYVRRKMYLHFKGKAIIQPMDVVNVFISSKSNIDTKLIQGFASQTAAPSVTKKIDSLINNISNFGKIESFLDGDQMSSEYAEMAAIAGPDFPPWLWRLYKNDFTKQAAGTSVFVGLVENPVSQKYESGMYSLGITCKDNSSYFSKSQINFKPGVDLDFGSLYDPLTPFDVSYDASTGVPMTGLDPGDLPPLLRENIALINSGVVKSNNGRFRGRKLTQALMKSQDKELFFGATRQVLNDPNGLVYRWKEGVATLTKTQGAAPRDTIINERPQLLTNSPFAGQDVMNVLSLLVTGQPYNYNSFLKAAISNGNAFKNERDNESQIISYIEGLTNDLSKKNKIWGDFVPFKKLIINDAAKSFILSGQNDFVTRDNKLTGLITKRAKLIDELFSVASNLAKDSQTVGRDKDGQLLGSEPEEGKDLNIEEISLRGKISELDMQIESAKYEFYEATEKLTTSKPNGSITIVGNDISLGPEGSGSASTEGARQRSRLEFRQKLNTLTQRRLWKVKANNDTNLFIVDDQYDNNYDIMAFERAIGASLKLFENEYVNLKTQIESAASILGMEIYADTQGHIQVKPPSYNRVPSSVFYNMFKAKNRTGIKIFPEFLESLLFNQIKGIINQLEIIEDEIRLRGLALGLVSKNQYDPDDAIASALGEPSLLSFASSTSSGGFKFLSNGFTGKIGDKSIQSIVAQAKPEITEENFIKPLDQLSSKLTQATSNVLFDPLTREELIKHLDFQQSYSQNATDVAYNIRQRLSRSKGQVAPTISEIISNSRTDTKISQVKALGVVNEISNFVSERQQLILSLTNAIRNIREGVQINESGKGASSAFYPSLNTKGTIPQILEHMIEDETSNDLGPGSGARYVIRDINIISFSVEENAPDYTLVNVNGLFGEGLPQSPANLAIRGPGGNGNFVTSAYAIDYDMWRMYGFRAGNAVEAPYFSNPDSQCAPMAVFLLNLARANILKASITLNGNEYYQPGDVVYIESNDMLFYVEEVSHAFSYSGIFTTSLKLTYGHSPGEYIPTMLDMVGKFLYNAKDFSTSFRSTRFGNANGDNPAGVIIFDNKGTTNLQKQILEGSRGRENQKALANIAIAASGAVNPVFARGIEPIVELRIYGENGVFDTILEQSADIVRQWLINPTKLDDNSITLIPDTDGSELNKIPPDKVSIVKIDVEDDGDESPSASALNSVRLILNNPISLERLQTNFGAVNIRSVLFTHIIDVWITYKEVVTSVTLGAPGQDPSKNEFNKAQQKIAEESVKLRSEQ